MTTGSEAELTVAAYGRTRLILDHGLNRCSGAVLYQVDSVPVALSTLIEDGARHLIERHQGHAAAARLRNHVSMVPLYVAQAAGRVWTACGLCGAVRYSCMYRAEVGLARLIAAARDHAGRHREDLASP